MCTIKIELQIYSAKFQVKKEIMYDSCEYLQKFNICTHKTWQQLSFMQYEFRRKS